MAEMASNLASSIRPGLRQATQPASPHTPSRFISSNFSSPGSGFRQEEDAVVIELGSRYLRAGFEGEHAPQCVVSFGPEDSRRLGDYRSWAPAGRKKDFDIEQWGKEHELWRMDLIDVDLGLVEDKLERAVREVYNRYLLTNVGTARLILVLPSLLPHPLISTLITTLFTRWNYSLITLLPSPTMAAVGAGVRSALTIDLGWSETTATAIYEYREVKAKRTTRSMQSLLRELGKALDAYRKGRDKDMPPIDFDLAEELMVRMVWCKEGRAENVGGGGTLHAEAQPGTPELNDIGNKEVDIDWPTKPSSRLVKLPFKVFSEPVEKAFFPPETPSQYLDDHEHSLTMLLYETLQALPPDTRATCMSRIIFVGGGSDIPGLTQRIIHEVDSLIKRYGWSAVRGEKVDHRRGTLRDIGQGRAEKPIARSKEPLSPGKDYVEERVQKQQAKDSIATVQGELRQVGSLGAWAGASLMASMKIKGFVEIEREKFLQHGLGGAHRDMEISVVPQRTSYAAPISRAGVDRTSWTLAGWG
jgi:actin-related protein